MAGCTLYSVIMKLSDEDAGLISMYCADRNMLVTKRRRDDKTLPNLFVVWGTKKELTEFQKYF